MNDSMNERMNELNEDTSMYVHGDIHLEDIHFKCISIFIKSNIFVHTK